jgi:hypothetical protein
MPQEIELPKSVDEAIAQGWEYDCADLNSTDQQMTAVGIASFIHPDHRAANEEDDLRFVVPFTCKFTYEAPRWKLSRDEEAQIFNREPGTNAA